MLIKMMTVDLSNVELFNELAEIADKTRFILSGRLISNYEIDRLGHCGTGGEFVHSFAFPIMHVSMDKRDGLSKKDISQKFKKSLLEVAQKKSQLSASSKTIADELQGNEIVLDAIPRSIQDLREWAKNTDTLDSDLTVELNTMMDRAEEIYTPIQEAIRQELKL